MTSVAIRPEELRDHIAQALGALARSVTLARGEVTVVVAADQYLQAMQLLRDAPTCRFEQLIDLCGLDYSAYADRVNEGPRYAVVSHLLSVSLNQRVRVRVFCPQDDMPVVASVTGLWASGARGVRPVRCRVRRAQRPAPYPHGLWLHRPPVPQGLPAVGSCGNALRRRSTPRDV